MKQNKTGIGLVVNKEYERYKRWQKRLEELVIMEGDGSDFGNSDEVGEHFDERCILVQPDDLMVVMGDVLREAIKEAVSLTHEDIWDIIRDENMDYLVRRIYKHFGVDEND